MKTRRQKLADGRASISSSLVNVRGNREVLPIDLIIEVLSRLHVKSIARCRCVSKLWASTIRSPNFIELVMTRSATTRPQLLFACKKNGEVFFYTSPQPHNLNEVSSPIAINYHMSSPLCNNKDYTYPTEILPPVRGLVCVKETQILNARKYTMLVVCNPSTGQSLTLPRVKTRRVDVKCFFGYDPIGKQFKLLSMTRPKYARKTMVSEEHQVLTLGNGKLSWRMIECSIPHFPLHDGICINGVLYYQAKVQGFERIACFDVRSEKFTFIEGEIGAMRGKLVNYKDKLATLKADNSDIDLCEGSKSFELCVLEDAEKHEWSTHTYVIPPLSHDIVSPNGMRIIGITRTGEIVLFPYWASDPYYYLYYNLEQSTITKVEVQGKDVSEYHSFLTFIDHVEDVELGGVFQTS